VSRLVPEKAPAAFYRAAAALGPRPDVVFRLWGDGPERARLEALRDALGLGPGAGGGGAGGAAAELMKATEDVPAALAEMDVFAYPTTGERPHAGPAGPAPTQPISLCPRVLGDGAGLGRWGGRCFDVIAVAAAAARSNSLSLSLRPIRFESSISMEAGACGRTTMPLRVQ
jgi:glycosyltransferase involved in cell wall biosynthesis